ncbi:hypothetical protein DRE_03815 [Drechslerella stenobrocha 248]|uniref:Uncharacterized protein n=1 Tax=Drechslerella stenobrocha 248 TaxID=1043628 RepID=W7I4G2_9PEZI|nr:hypothetical protein DRE_03815 [Drechslerella stenobrocha 248]
MASLNDRARKAKTVYTLDTPSATFLTPEWPALSPQAASTILTALTTLLTDLQTLQPPADTNATAPATLPGILVGVNSVTAHLEHLASLCIPAPLSTKPHDPASKQKTPPPPPPPLAVLVARADQPTALHAHLPLLCAMTAAFLAALTDEQGTPLGIVAQPDAFASGARKDGGASWLETRSKAVQTTIGEPRKRRKAGDNDTQDDPVRKDATKKRRGG